MSSEPPQLYKPRRLSVRRAPLPGSGVQAEVAHDMERGLVESLLGPASPRSARPTQRSPPRSPSSAGSNDTDLIGVMSRRLREAEAQLVVQSKTLVKQAKELEQTRVLRQENEALRRQLAEMETFLNDYGLMWIGSPADAEAQEEEQEAEEEEQVVQAPPQALAGPPVPVRVLQARVAELNALAGDESELVRLPDGKTTLRNKVSVCVSVYADGFRVDKGPLRSYQHESSQRFFCDLADGFFPWEFQERYPNGVHLDLEDLTDQQGAAAPSEAFTGRGRVLGSNVRSLSRTPEAEQSAAELLAKLPERVVRGARVVEIRKEVAGMLGAGGGVGVCSGNQGPIVVETDALHALEDGRAADVTTLRIRHGSGPVMVVKMRHTDTIGALRVALKPHVHPGQAYELRTAFPARAYADDAESMQDAGLTPNATLDLRYVGQ